MRNDPPRPDFGAHPGISVKTLISFDIDTNFHGELAERYGTSQCPISPAVHPHDGFRRPAGAIHLAALHGYAGTLDDVAFRRKMKKQTR